MREPKKTAPTKPASKSRALELHLAPGTSEDKALADAAVGGLACNVATLVDYSKRTFGELSLSDCVQALLETNEAVKRGDLTMVETMLTAQSIALNAIFAEMARRASLNMGEYLDAAERYMRLALKAQGQCRATLETLAAIKNPPVVFARQANIAHGPQQVNNGPGAPKAAQYAPGSARPGETASAPTELLEGRTHGSTQLDTRATPAASRAHPQLEPVAAIDGAAYR